MKIYSQYDRPITKLAKLVYASVAAVVLVSFGLMITGLAMYLSVKIPQWLGWLLVFLVLNPLAQMLKFLYSWVVG